MGYIGRIVAKSSNSVCHEFIGVLDWPHLNVWKNILHIAPAQYNLEHDLYMSTQFFIILVSETAMLSQIYVF